MNHTQQEFPMKLHTLVTAIALAASGAAFAQTAPAAPVKDPAATPRIDQMQVNQQKRINQGVASGQLTPAETAKLDQGQAKLQAEKVSAKADGTVTAAERQKLRREARRNSHRIAKQKHDKQKVAPAA